MTPGDLVRATRDAGRRVLAVTDHDTASGGVAVRQYVDATGNDILVLIGMELSTSDAGHVIVFGEGVEEDWGWRAGSPTPRDLPDTWVAIQAHPFRSRLKAPRGTPLVDDLPDLPDTITAVELWNGNDRLVKGTDRLEELDAVSRAYIARQGRVAVAASDAHRLTSLHAYFTTFAHPVTGVADLVTQIRTGTVNPASATEADLTRRRDAWRRRKIIGWYVDSGDWRECITLGIDRAEARDLVRAFETISRLMQNNVSLPEIADVTDLPSWLAEDIAAIVREERMNPPRIR